MFANKRVLSIFPCFLQNCILILFVARAKPAGKKVAKRVTKKAGASKRISKKGVKKAGAKKVKRTAPAAAAAPAQGASA